MRTRFIATTTQKHIFNFGTQAFQHVTDGPFLQINPKYSCKAQVIGRDFGGSDVDNMVCLGATDEELDTCCCAMCDCTPG